MNYLFFHLRRGVATMLIVLAVFCSCDDFLAIDPPTTYLTSDTVFESDATVRAALAGIYQRLGDRGLLSGEESFPWMTGLASDELDNYFSDSRAEFYANAVTPLNTQLIAHWSQLYFCIYSANAILEGVGQSIAISGEVKRQAEGEALFLRAFCFAYLTQMWGRVPLALTTDYQENRALAQDDISTIYAQIFSDLRKAETLLPASYSGADRLHPISWTATALRARCHLYRGEWAEAEAAASLVLGAALYQLEAPGLVFGRPSQETLWHLSSGQPTINTWDGFRYILVSAPTRVALAQSLVDSFEEGDLRKVAWVRVLEVPGGSYFYPYKYRVRSTSASVAASEYLVMMRLAEQYLIRAEARFAQGKGDEALDDLNVVRGRAGLPLIERANEGEFAALLERERRSELFTEGCHRWLDLKRWDRSNAVLGSQKSGWASTDVLFPIPQLELNLNVKLVQNEGY